MLSCIIYYYDTIILFYLHFFDVAWQFATLIYSIYSSD